MTVKNLITELSNGAFIGNIDTVKKVVDEFLEIETQKDQIDYAKKVADAQNNINKIQLGVCR